MDAERHHTILCDNHRHPHHYRRRDPQHNPPGDIQAKGTHE